MSTLHEATFEYLKPNDEQLAQMSRVRLAFKEFVEAIDAELPAGPDKTFILRQLRDSAMWVNVCLTRQADGGPRK